MSAELISFVTQKRAQGVPWPHIAVMAGKPMSALEPYKALEAGYRASKAKAEAVEFEAAAPAKAPVPVDLIIPPPAMRLIALKIAAEHGIPLEVIVGPLRRKHVTAARQHIMWALVQEGKYSTVMIGAFLGGRDHTTVLFGAKRHAKRIAEAAA